MSIVIFLPPAIISATKLNVPSVSVGVSVCLASPDDDDPTCTYISLVSVSLVIPPLSPQALYMLYREVFRSISCPLLITPIYLLNLATEHQ